MNFVKRFTPMTIVFIMIFVQVFESLFVIFFKFTLCRYWLPLFIESSHHLYFALTSQKLSVKTT